MDVPCEKAYGAYDPKALLTVPRSFIERGERLERGQRIVWRSAQKPQPVAVLVADCDESSVRLDFNHPLAGEDLKYWIKVGFCHGEGGGSLIRAACRGGGRDSRRPVLRPRCMRTRLFRGCDRGAGACFAARRRERVS